MDYDELPDDAPGGDSPEEGPYADQVAYWKRRATQAYAQGYQDGVAQNNARRDYEAQTRARKQLRAVAERLPVVVPAGGVRWA